LQNFKRGAISKFTQFRRRNASAKFVKFKKIDEKFIKAFYRFDLRDLTASRRQIRAPAAKRQAMHPLHRGDQSGVRLQQQQFRRLQEK